MMVTVVMTMMIMVTVFMSMLKLVTGDAFAYTGVGGVDNNINVGDN